MIEMSNRRKGARHLPVRDIGPTVDIGPDDGYIMMKLDRKVWIDRYLGGLLCWFFIPITKTLGWVLHRDHSVGEENVRRIVVAKFMGLGSIVHSMPMLRALKRKYPRARIVFLTRKANTSLFHHIEDVDDLLLIDDSSPARLVFSNLKAILAMMSPRIDLYFDLELFSIYGALMSLFSLARNRFGFFFSRETGYKTHLYTHLMYFNFQMPMRLCYLQLARMAHIADFSSWDLVPLQIDPELIRTARSKLDAMLVDGYGRGVLAFNANASDLSFERRWPRERFAEVARYFAGKGYTILFVGAPDERAYVQSVVDLVGGGEAVEGRIFNIAGLFGFSEFLAVLKTVDGVLTNDTGIMNFSYALGAATLSLFGPCTSVLYHVEGEQTMFLEKPVYCSPCLHHLVIAPCRGDNVCMQQIRTEEVIETLEKLLDPERVPGRPNPQWVLDQSGTPLGVLRTKGS